MVRVRVMVRVRFNDKVLNCSIWSTWSGVIPNPEFPHLLLQYTCALF